MRYKCHTCNKEKEYNIRIVNVPQAAIKSQKSIIRFLFQRSAIVPAINRNKIVGRNKQMVMKVKLEAVRLDCKPR